MKSKARSKISGSRSCFERVSCSAGRLGGFHDPHHPLPAVGACAFEHEIAVLFRTAEIDHLGNLALGAEHILRICSRAFAGIEYQSSSACG